jgi:hypothetical protein
MLKINWKKVPLDVTEIHAKPATGLWTKALEFVTGPIKFKITASGNWKFDGDEGGTCDANGSLTSHLDPKACINEHAPVGALIGKIGHSTASIDGVKSFVVGSFCIVQLSANESGPLFLTINDAPSGFFDNEGKLQVEVHEHVDPPPLIRKRDEPEPDADG